MTMQAYEVHEGPDYSRYRPVDFVGAAQAGVRAGLDMAKTAEEIQNQRLHNEIERAKAPFEIAKAKAETEGLELANQKRKITESPERLRQIMADQDRLTSMALKEKEMSIEAQQIAHEKAARDLTAAKEIDAYENQQSLLDAEEAALHAAIVKEQEDETEAATLGGKDISSLLGEENWLQKGIEFVKKYPLDIVSQFIPFAGQGMTMYRAGKKVVDKVKDVYDRATASPELRLYYGTIDTIHSTIDERTDLTSSQKEKLKTTKDPEITEKLNKMYKDINNADQLSKDTDELNKLITSKFGNPRVVSETKREETLLAKQKERDAKLKVIQEKRDAIERAIIAREPDALKKQRRSDLLRDKIALRREEEAMKREVVKASARTGGNIATPAAGSMIRVRDKTSGKTGTIPAKEFDPNKFDKI